MKALWFRVSTRRQLEKGETGWTSLDTKSVPLSEAMDVILSELPEEAILVEHDLDTDITTIVIDWGKVPDAIRYPQIPARR